MFSGKIGGSLDIPRKKCEGGDGARDTVEKGVWAGKRTESSCTVHVSGIRHTLLSVVQ